MKQNFIRLKKWFFLLLIIIPTSCEKEHNHEQDSNPQRINIEQIKSDLINKGNGTIYTPNLTAYNYSPTTKANYQQSYNISDLLWNKSVSKTTGEVTFIAVEISNPGKAAFFSLTEKIPAKQFKRPIKTFLLCKHNNKTGHTEYRISKLINFNDNLNNVSEFNPLNLSTFIGMIIHSDINGNFISTKLFEGSKFHNIRLTKPSEASSSLLFNIFLTSQILSKSGDTDESEPDENGGTLEEAYCIADGNQQEEEDQEDEDWYEQDEGGGDNMDDTSGGGGGGSSGGEQGEIPPVTLSISSIGGGSTLGAGTYEWGATVSVMAIPDLGSTFIQWTGGLSSYGSDLGFSFQIFSDASGTAVFHRYQPCRDGSTADPLMNMALQGTPLNPINGGRFAALRVRTNKEGVRETYQHQGLDLRVEQDTPSYSILEGTVIGIRNNFDPNVPWNKYEAVYGYLGPNTYSAGNMVKVRSFIDGNTIDIVYMHLNNVNGSLSIGSSIDLGTIIGVGGSTGAAKSPSSGGPHLHLYVYENGVKKDVENYIYTKFDSNANITRTCNN